MSTPGLVVASTGPDGLLGVEQVATGADQIVRRGDRPREQRGDAVSDAPSASGSRRRLRGWAPMPDPTRGGDDPAAKCGALDAGRMPDP
jgi:hypothetical protein